MSNHERIRNGGAVLRYHARRTIGQQSVAEHSWGVAMMLYELCQPTEVLLRAALSHDLAEYDTGDVPFTAKRMSVPFKDALVQLETEIDAKLGFMPLLEPEDLWLLKMADMLELCWYAVEQKRLGSNYCDEWFINGTVFISSSIKSSKFPTGRVGAALSDVLTAWSRK